MTTTDIEYIDYINVKSREINDLKSDIKISTMCASCKLNTRLNIDNIEKYLQLSKNDILTVKMNDERIRTLISLKKKPKRNKKNDTHKKKENSKSHFYNQITLVIRINNDDNDDLTNVPQINMKLFKNGSIQMSGCKSVNSINIVLNKLLIRLREIKGRIENGNINEIKYVEEIDKLTIKDFKIDMINSNYQIDMLIDRDKLYNLLQKKKIKSSYEPCIRACVIIKCCPDIENEDQREVSIFVFQKGNIIITGARCKNHIIYAYKYMNTIIETHKEEIVKKNEDKESKLIFNYYNQILEENKLGLIKI